MLPLGCSQSVLVLWMMKRTLSVCMSPFLNVCRGKCTSILQTTSIRKRNKLGYCAVTNFMSSAVDRCTFQIMNAICGVATHLNEEREERQAWCVRLPSPSGSHREEGPGALLSASKEDTQGHTASRPSGLSGRKNLFFSTFSYRKQTNKEHHTE